MMPMRDAVNTYGVARTLRGLELLLDKPLLGAVVVSQDLEVRYLAPGVLAVPAAWFLSPPDYPEK